MIARRLLLVLHVAAAVAVAADLDGVPRIVVVGLWVSIVPGWSLVAHVRVDVATKVSLAVSTSLALALVVSALLVLVDRYRVLTSFWLLFVLATPGVLLAQFRRPLGAADVAGDAAEPEGPEGLEPSSERAAAHDPDSGGGPSARRGVRDRSDAKG